MRFRLLHRRPDAAYSVVSEFGAFRISAGQFTPLLARALNLADGKLFSIYRVTGESRDYGYSPARNSIRVLLTEYPGEDQYLRAKATDRNSTTFYVCKVGLSKLLLGYIPKDGDVFYITFD